MRRPLLILTDQEGGEVRRLPGAPALSEKQIGEGSDPATLAADAGLTAGQNLAGAGINVNLAPVLDTYRQQGNFIDEYERSYSSDPAEVSRLGAAFITSQQSTGVAATAKHFPGLGAANQPQNTDATPVTLDQPLAEVRTVDEAPFRATVQAGVKLVMLSWAIYPALDPSSPAGLSPTVIQDELRQRLHFTGVTISDGIDAGAVVPYGDVGTRAVRAASAGADLILCAATGQDANTPAIGQTVLHAVAAAIAAGQIPRSSAVAAAQRVLALRLHP